MPPSQEWEAFLYLIEWREVEVPRKARTEAGFAGRQTSRNDGNLLAPTNFLSTQHTQVGTELNQRDSANLGR